MKAAELSTAIRRSKRSQFEDLFAFQCRAYELPDVHREYTFARDRKFRFDFAFVAYRVAVEIDGLVIKGRGKSATLGMGRHNTITGMRGDREKTNLAALLGWFVLRFEQRQITNGEAVEFTSKVLRERGWNPRRWEFGAATSGLGPQGIGTESIASEHALPSRHHPQDL